MNNSSKLPLIYHFFYRLIHLFVSLVLIIYNFFKQLFPRNETKIISINSLKKIPKHIGIAINEELIHYEDLVHITKWCQLFDISYLSIFKNNGSFGFLFFLINIFKPVFKKFLFI